MSQTSLTHPLPLEDVETWHIETDVAVVGFLPRRAEGYASGMSVGDVTFFGRLAGRALWTAGGSRGGRARRAA